MTAQLPSPSADPCPICDEWHSEAAGCRPEDLDAAIWFRVNERVEEAEDAWRKRQARIFREVAAMVQGPTKAAFEVAAEMVEEEGEE
jgi:hypothetical protein